MSCVVVFMQDEGREIAVQLNYVLDMYVIAPPQVVVEGCCHGELDKIYEVIGQLKEREGMTVDLLICCGDFQVSLSHEDKF